MFLLYADMPEWLQKQMVSIQFSDPVGERSLEWSVKLCDLAPEDRLRLELVDNTISKYVYTSYNVIITASLIPKPRSMSSMLHEVFS